MYHTEEWPYLMEEYLAEVNCPDCLTVLRGVVSDDGRRVALPAHGFSPHEPCSGGARWYPFRRRGLP